MLLLLSSGICPLNTVHRPCLLTSALRPVIDAENLASSDDLKMLKKEESSSVILHLEPIPYRDNNNIAGTCATVLAVEAPHDEMKAEGEKVEYGYPITCGDCSAILLIKKFVCPGINVRCVKFNDEIISPKQFVHRSGKSTLKDWKRAIRLGGVMLRKMMDSGQIDFYQHSIICSNTCRSTKCDVQSRAVVHPSPSCVTGEEFNDATGAEEFSEVKSAPEKGMGLSPNQSHKPPKTNGHLAGRERSDSPDEVLSLWKTVADTGLMGDVMSNVQSKLSMTFKGVEARSTRASLQIKDAVVLNTLCEVFGLLESVKRAVKLRQNLKDNNEIPCHFYGTNRLKRKKIEKNSTCKASSSKQLQLEHHASLTNSLNILSPVTTSPVIFPFSAFGLSKHTRSPLHSGHFSAPISTDTAPYVQASDMSMG